MTEPAPLVLDEWNGHNPSDAALESVIEDWLRDGGDWLSLYEMWTKRPSLQRLAKKHGLVLFQQPSGNRAGALVGEAGSTAVLLNKKTTKVAKWRVVSHAIKWFVYSARRWHTGRQDVLVRFTHKVDKQVYAGRAIHLPTNGHDGGNRQAFMEQMNSIEKWFENTSTRVAKFAIGDGNDDLNFFRNWAPKGVRVAGNAPEVVLLLHAVFEAVKTLSKSHSDHHRLRTRIRPNR